jgi:hypothetical protein
VRLSDLSPEVLAPVKHLLGDRMDLEFPDPCGYFVLVLQYIRPEARELAGGQKFYYAEVTKKEDEYQGRMGIVLALGPDAYRDPVKYPTGPWVQPGDAVIWPTLTGASQRTKHHGLVIAFLQDDQLVGKAVDMKAALEGV